MCNLNIFITYGNKNYSSNEIKLKTPKNIPLLYLPLCPIRDYLDRSTGLVLLKIIYRTTDSRISSTSLVITKLIKRLDDELETN